MSTAKCQHAPSLPFALEDCVCLAWSRIPEQKGKEKHFCNILCWKLLLVDPKGAETFLIFPPPFVMNLIILTIFFYLSF